MANVFEVDQLNDTRIFAQSIIDTIWESLLVLDNDLRVVSANRAFYRQFEVSRAETEGQLIYDLGNGQWNIPALRHALETIIPQNTSFENFIVEHAFQDLGKRIMLLNGRRVEQEGGRRSLVLLAINDITGRKKAEQEKLDFEARYRKFVENINSIIIGFDNLGRITFFNHFSEDVFGYKREEVLGRGFVETLLRSKDELGNDNTALIGDLMENPEKYRICESEGVRKDGSRIVFSWSAKAIRGGDGKVAEILIDGNDITTLRKDRQQLRDALQLIEHSPDIIARVEKGRFAFVNPSFVSLAEMPKEALTDKSLSEVASLARTIEPLVVALQNVQNRKTFQSAEVGLDDRQFHLYVVPELDDSGNVITQMAYARDITQMIQIRKQLILEQQLLQTIIDSIPVMITIYDEPLERVKLNREFTLLTGWNEEDLREHNILELCYPDPGYRETVRQYMKALQPGWVDFRLTSKDGSTIDSSWANIRLPDGRRVGIGIEVGGRKRFEGELIKARELAIKKEREALAAGELLREQNIELDTFNHTVSHDLRAPLRAIGGFAQILCEDYADRMDLEARQFVGKIQENVAKMDQFIGELLALSRTARQAMERTDLDMRGLAQAVVQEQKAGAAERSLEFVIESLPFAKADPTMMRQVWTNLIGNSMKFTRTRDVARIHIGAQDLPSGTVYYIRDNGVGFDAKNAKGLFEAFQRLHPEGKYEGTGVGLAIVGRIIRKHGGRIWAESEPGKGATFYFTLG